MEEQNVEQAIKLITEKSKELDRFKLQKQRYVEISAQIRTFAEQMIKFANEIDPVATSLHTRACSDINYDEISRQLFEKLKAGTQITTAFVESIYPELSTGKKANYVMKMLQKMPKVEKAVDGRKIRLFYKYA